MADNILTLKQNISRVFPGTAALWRCRALSGAIAFAVGIAIAAGTGWPLARQVSGGLTVVSIIVSVVAVASGRRWFSIGLFIVAGVFAQLGARALQVQTYDDLASGLRLSLPVVISGRVISAPVENRNGVTYTVRCDSVCGPDGPSALAGKLVRCRSRTMPTLGKRVLLRGNLKLPRLPADTGGFDEYQYMMSSGIWAYLNVDGQIVRDERVAWRYRAMWSVRENVYRTLAHIRSSDRNALMRAAFLGERTDTGELRGMFQNAGISHLLAISGLHVGLLVAAVMTALGPIPIPPRWKLGVVLAAVWAYVAIVGPLPSLMRAALMATVLIGAQWVQRISDTCNALGLAAVVWLTISPQSLFSAGFQLSFTATFAIILVMRASKTQMELVELLQIRPVRWTADSILVSVAAFTATAPILAHHFGSISLFGVFANLVVVGFMNLCMWLFIAAFSVQPLLHEGARMIMGWSDFMLKAIVAVAGWSRPYVPVSVTPFSTAATACYAAALLAIVTCSRKAFTRVLTAGIVLLLLTVISDQAAGRHAHASVDTRNSRSGAYRKNRYHGHPLAVDSVFQRRD